MTSQDERNQVDIVFLNDININLSEVRSIAQSSYTPVKLSDETLSSLQESSNNSSKVPSSIFPSSTGSGDTIVPALIRFRSGS